MHAVHQRDDPGVAHEHRLRAAGRARRERDGGDVGLVDRGRGRRARPGTRAPPAVAVDHDDGQTAGARSVLGRRHERRGPDVGEHVRDLGAGEARVDRHVHRAGAPDAEERGDDVGAVRQHHADRLARADPALVAQDRRQRGRLGFEFGTGALHRAVVDEHGVGRKRLPRRGDRSAASAASARGSAPGEPGRALLLERGQPLAEVLAARRELHGEGLAAEMLLERRRAARLQQPLGEAECDGGAGREPPRDLLDRGVELIDAARRCGRGPTRRPRPRTACGRAAGARAPSRRRPGAG